MWLSYFEYRLHELEHLNHLQQQMVCLQYQFLNTSILPCLHYHLPYIDKRVLLTC